MRKTLWQAEHKRAFKKAYNRENINCICVDAMGNLMKPSNVSNNFRKLLRKQKMRQIRFHDLRHTCASLLVGAGVSMKSVQLWLGHSTFFTTADIYAHLDSHALAEPATAVADILNMAKYE